MKITLSLRFLYIFWESGLLCAILPMITNKPDMSRLLLHISVTDNNYLIVIFICLEKKNGRQLFPSLISTSRIVTTN